MSSAQPPARSSKSNRGRAKACGLGSDATVSYTRCGLRQTPGLPRRLGVDKKLSFAVGEDNFLPLSDPARLRVGTASRVHARTQRRGKRQPWDNLTWIPAISSKMSASASCATSASLSSASDSLPPQPCSAPADVTHYRANIAPARPLASRFAWSTRSTRCVAAARHFTKSCLFNRLGQLSLQETGLGTRRGR